MKSQELHWDAYDEYYNMVFGNASIAEHKDWHHPHDWSPIFIEEQIHLAISWRRLGTLRAAVGGAYRQAKENFEYKRGNAEFHEEHMGALSEIYWTVLGGEQGTDYGMPVDCYHTKEGRSNG